MRAAPTSSVTPDASSPLPAPPPGATLVGRFLDRYAKRYVGVYALGLAFLVATNALTVAIPDLIKQVFDALGSGAGRAEVDVFARWIGLAAVSVIVVRTLSRVLFFNPGRTIEFRVRNDMLRGLLSMSTSFFRRAGVGDLVSRATSDATFVRALVGFAVLNVLNLILAASMALWQMVRTDPWLTLWCVIPLIGSTWLLRKGIAWMYGTMREGQEELGRLSAHILESYGGVAVIQGSAATAAFGRKFDALNERYTDLNLKVAALRCFILPLARTVGSLCVFLLLYVGGQHVLDGALSVGDLAAYASYIGMLVSALAMAGWLLTALQRGYVSLQRVWQVVSLPTDRPHGETPLPLHDRGVALQVQGLSYRYPDAGEGEAEALTDVSFALQRGGVLGVYGPVGSGKSTLAMLVSGLISPPRGTVILEGEDLLDLAPDSLRREVAMVPQESFLFSRSLRANVGYVDPVDAIDTARVDTAVAQAALADDVARMPDGLETVVGERGLMLSGGQRQRTQIARALYAGARLLILDDVLSAVDHDTEERLLGTLRAEISAAQGDHGASAILVSTRLSALIHCDEILVLEGGRVVERGTHAQLAAGDGLYGRAWAVQRDDEDDDPAASPGPEGEGHAGGSGRGVTGVGATGA